MSEVPLLQKLMRTCWGAPHVQASSAAHAVNTLASTITLFPDTFVAKSAPYGTVLRCSVLACAVLCCPADQAGLQPCKVQERLLWPVQLLHQQLQERQEARQDLRGRPQDRSRHQLCHQQVPGPVSRGVYLFGVVCCLLLALMSVVSYCLVRLVSVRLPCDGL